MAVPFERLSVLQNLIVAEDGYHPDDQKLKRMSLFLFL